MGWGALSDGVRSDDAPLIETLDNPVGGAGG